MKNLNLTYENNDFEQLKKAKEHSKMNWEKFFYYVSQLYWREFLITKRRK